MISDRSRFSLTVESSHCIGVVYRIRDDSITVAFENMPDADALAGGVLVRLANEETHRRLKFALKNIKNTEKSVTLCNGLQWIMLIDKPCYHGF